MVNLIVRLMFSVLIIDLSIAFAWVGLLGYRELRNTYYEIFPNGIGWINKLIEVAKCWLSRLSKKQLKDVA